MKRNQIIVGIVFMMYVVYILFMVSSPIKSEEPKPIDIWEGLDKTEIAGIPLDSCYCTLLNGVIYQVNIKKKITFTYTQKK